MKLILALALSALCTAAAAGQPAYTVRPTELKAKPFIDAPTLASLGENSKVEVLARQSGWSQVKAGGATGWVKMLSLRLDDAGAPARLAGDNGLGALFNLARTGASGTVATTGVRGLGEEQLKNASPNADAVEQLGGYAVTRDEATQFARAGKLDTQKVSPLPGAKENKS